MKASCRLKAFRPVVLRPKGLCRLKASCRLKDLGPKGLCRLKASCRLKAALF